MEAANPRKLYYLSIHMGSHLRMLIYGVEIWGIKGYKKSLMEFRGSQEVQTVHAAAHGNLMEKVGKAKCFVI